MDINEIWNTSCLSVCQITQFKGDQRLGSGTGFKINGYILTNNHVYAPHYADRITIQFKQEGGIRKAVEKTYSRDELVNLLVCGDPQSSWDFAVIDGSDFKDIANLELISSNDEILIGEDCVFLGYPLNSSYLSIHKGIISAKYTALNDVRYLLIDGSVNKGNSGGPLLNSNGKVIGYVTLKKTGFSDNFANLKDSFSMNVAEIERNKNIGIAAGSIDLLQSIKAIQLQLDMIAREMERSSNVGIGIAFQLDEVRKAIDL